MTSAGAKRGAFVVIEGLDRSGKSTQSSAILARLHTLDIPAKLIKFPGTFRHFPQLDPPTLAQNPDRTTPIGKMIDAYLQSKSDLDDRAIHLLFSANRWELAYVRPPSIYSPPRSLQDRKKLT